MTKSEIKDDMRFRMVCYSYGISWSDFQIYDNVIILNSPKPNILVLLDENYNTIGIYDRNIEIDNQIITLGEIIGEYKQEYGTVNNKLPYPFQNYSLEQIVDLSNRVKILGTSHGHSCDLFVNEKLVEDDYNSIYYKLLLYAKYIGQQIQSYYLNLYKMKIKGFDYPNVYSYISGIETNIDECINSKIQNSKRPYPIDILNYLGEGRNEIEEYVHQLYAVIDLFLKEKGMSIKSGFEHYDELEVIEKNTFDMSKFADQLLRILEVSNDEVKSRSNENLYRIEIETINLESYLSDEVNKESNPRVLTKLKNKK